MLSCRGLRRQFGTRLAVDDVSFEVAAHRGAGHLPGRGRGRRLRNARRLHVPLDVVGAPIRAVGLLVLQAPAMDAFVKLTYDHAGVATVLPEVAVPAVFAALLLDLGVRLFAQTVYSPG